MRILTISTMLFLTACVHESVISLNANTVQIDVSAAGVYGRAGAQRIAFENAAKATIDYGYDKFVVVNNEGWNESSFSAGSYGSFGMNANQVAANAGGAQGSYATTNRHPESKMIIKMYHYKDKGAANAIDAHKIIEQKSN